MEKKCEIEHILSKYILNNIFDYLSENFHMKLFIYSKYFQNKLEFELLNYQEEYLKKLEINVREYFSCYSEIYGYHDYDKNFLKNKLQNDLSKNNLDIPTFIEKYGVNFFEKLNIKLKEPEKIFIDIHSPFFDIISNTELFGDIYIIPINIQFLEKYNLKDDYIKAFEKLNNSNSKYFSLHFSYINGNDINYLNKFKNHFKKFKCLEIKPQKKVVIKNHEIFLNNLFFLEDISQNLLHLKINYNQINVVDINILKNINNFKLLEELNLNGFKSNENLVLNLKNLKKINFKNCINFTFEEDSLLNLENLDLGMCLIHKSKSLLKLPKLVECRLENNNYKIKYNLIFDFKSMENLKILYSDVPDFINLDKSKLEILKFRGFPNTYFTLEKEMLEKIISIKTLKEIHFWLIYLDYNEISKINGQNNSIKNLSLVQYNDKNDCTLYNLIQKFPNLSEISIKTQKYFKNNENIAPPQVKIVENNESQITKISIIEQNKKSIKLFCKSYKDLEYIYFNFYNEFNDLKNCFPLFNNENKIIFESLKSFYFEYDNNYLDLNAFYNNIYNIPNLQNFSIKGSLGYNTTKSFYEEFIMKLLDLKLKEINIEFTNYGRYENNRYYSFDELKLLNPKFKPYKIIISSGKIIL